MKDYSERYGEWALVLGGSEGLGRAIAMRLAERKMNIALAARRQGPLEDAAHAISDRYGVETKIIQLDLGNDDAVSQIERGMDGKQVSFLLYNAAAEPHGEFLDLDIEDHLWNIQVNITAVTRIVHHFGRAMVDRGKGGIVLTSSLAAATGLYSWVSYGAAKAYDQVLGEGLWYELGRKGVDACTLMIGTTWTDNFRRTQKKLGGVFAESRTPENLPEGMAIPQLPEDASASLFAQIDNEWLPVIFTNPEDKPRWDGMAAMASKHEVIPYAAQMQKDWYD